MAVAPSSFPAVPVIGLFAPVHPAADAAVRQRAQLVCAAVAKALAVIRLPGDAGADPVTPVIRIASTPLVAAGDAAGLVAGLGRIDILLAVVDGPVDPSAVAVLAEAFPQAHVALVAGNGPARGAVGAANILIGGFAARGRLCHALIGDLPDRGQAPEFSARAKSAIQDLGWGLAAACWLRGRRVLVAADVSEGPAHALGVRLGIEELRQPVSPPAASLRSRRGPLRDELRDLSRWALDGQWAGRFFADPAAIRDDLRQIHTATTAPPAPRITAAARRDLERQLAHYLALRDQIRDLGCSAAVWSGTAELSVAATLFASTVDHDGRKAAFPFASGDDLLGVLTDLCFSALTGGSAVLPGYLRTVYEPADIQRRADDLGLRLDPQAAYLQRGLLHLGGPGSLDWGLTSSLIGTADELSVGYVSPGGIPCFIGRLTGTDEVASAPHGEARTVELPPMLAESLCHAAGYRGTHTWLVPDAIPAALAAIGFAGDRLSVARSLPTRRWQHFSDATGILSAPWDGVPAFVPSRDRPTPVLYRLAGGEALAKRTARHP